MLGQNNVWRSTLYGNILLSRLCAHFRGNSRNGSAIFGWPASMTNQRERKRSLKKRAPGANARALSLSLLRSLLTTSSSRINFEIAILVVISRLL